MMDDLSQLSGHSPAILVLTAGAVSSAVGAVLLILGPYLLGRKLRVWK